MQLPREMAEMFGTQTNRPSAAQVLRQALDAGEVPDGTNGAVHSYAGDNNARYSINN